MTKQNKFYLLFKDFNGKIRYSTSTTATQIKKDIKQLRKFGYTRSMRKQNIKKDQYYYNKEGK